jgi:hypothetical protein
MAVMPRVQSCLALLALGIALSAQVSPIEHPNLSGSWKLNVGRSGPILPRGTEALTIILDHRDPSIEYSETRTVSGKITHSSRKKSTIDGRLRIEHPAPGETGRFMQTWEGSTLVMHWELTDSMATSFPIP